jgi:hypothetical protein
MSVQPQVHLSEYYHSEFQQVIEKRRGMLDREALG